MKYDKIPTTVEEKGRNKIKSNLQSLRPGQAVSAVSYLSLSKRQRRKWLASGWVARSWRHSHCQDSVFALLQGLFQLSEMGPKAVFFYLHSCC